MRFVTLALVHACLALCLLAGLPSEALAWGAEGHRIVARIAQSRLDDHGKAGVARVLGGKSLESIATYADDIRTRRPETRLWHFVDIPVGEAHYDPGRDCQATPGGDCVVAELDRCIATLEAHTASADAQTEALKFLVHFVGDLHQPLHCATRLLTNPDGTPQIDPVTNKQKTDRGGNDLQVDFFGDHLTPFKNNGQPVPMELHYVWDSTLILHKMGEHEHGTAAEIATYADGLIAAITSTVATEMSGGTFVDWAEQSHALAESNAYRADETTLLAGGENLADPYFTRNIDVVNLQLERAGVRLANLINDVFKDEPIGPTPPPGPPARVYVYYNPHGHAYHLKTCPFHRSSSRRILLTTAKQRGLRPCGVCHPPS
jgi:hypothetical protein